MNSDLRQRLPQVFHAGIGGRGAVEEERLQPFEFPEVFQSGVRDAAAVAEVEPLQVPEALEVLQAGVGNLGAGEDEPPQGFDRPDVFQAAIGDPGASLSLSLSFL